MANRAGPGDLIVLVADKDIEYTMRGLLTRPEALGIRSVSTSVVPYDGRDPGCLRTGPEFLRGYQRQFQHALLILDREGSGGEAKNRMALEEELEGRLKVSWENRAAAVVIDPELESWVWSDSPHVEEVLGWTGREPTLHQWLLMSGSLVEGQVKPIRPKEAALEALRLSNTPWSPSLYRQLALRVSVRRCKDPAFAKLCQTLKRWFPAGR
jgi:hypothetical protein